MSTAAKRDRHPCFNAGVKGKYGRAHLPVAPKCNIKCNYCDRRYNCVNESRPGVTGSVLAPFQAVRYLERVLEREPRLSVAGIAGPGDPFANPRETLETMRLVRKRFHDLLLCLSSNGLNLPPYLDEVADIGVSHVTITVNAVDPEIGRRIYAWVRDGKVVYRNIQGAKLLLSRQIEAIRSLKERGITVKVNTVVIPGINDDHIIGVAREMKTLGVDLMNCMPMYRNPGTPFADIPEPDAALVKRIQKEAETYLPQMRHCRRCRGDAVGLLDEDRCGEFYGCLAESSNLAPDMNEERPYVAAASREGMLTNQHLGEAERFFIWNKTERGFEVVGERPAPKPGSGPQRWFELAELLKDCRAVLAAAAGDTPKTLLGESGLPVVEASGFIETALQVIYEGGPLPLLKGRQRGLSAGGGCPGGGGGCSG